MTRYDVVSHHACVRKKKKTKRISKTEIFFSLLGNANRTGSRRNPNGHCARDVSIEIRQPSVYTGIDDDDKRGETPSDKCLGAVRNISVLHCVQVDDKHQT